jgi:hypothetical protein
LQTQSITAQNSLPSHQQAQRKTNINLPRHQQTTVAKPVKHRAATKCLPRHTANPINPPKAPVVDRKMLRTAPHTTVKSALKFLFSIF